MCDHQLSYQWHFRFLRRGCSGIAIAVVDNADDFPAGPEVGGKRFV